MATIIDGTVKAAQAAGEHAVDAAGAAGRWWHGWLREIDRPMSWRATWRLSKLDKTRIPAGRGRGRVINLIRVSNATDRLLLFALLLIIPSGLQGPVRWLIIRPVRRWALYAFTAVFGLWFHYVVR